MSGRASSASRPRGPAHGDSSRSYGLWVHGNNDTTGAVRAAESITKAMGWQRVHDPVAVIGAPGKDDTEAVWELAATVAASLL